MRASRARRPSSIGTPEQRKARLKVSNSIISGKFQRQPCEVCGSEPAQAHHEDYSKPLEVQWLCSPHHYAVHHPTTLEAAR